MTDCEIAGCDYRPRWRLEHRGFTPTFAVSCNHHLAENIDKLMVDIGHGVVWVSRWT